MGGQSAAQPNLVWHDPGKDFHDAVPLGNGDIGISAWTSKNGELLFYLGKTDAYDENNRLCKPGLVHIRISPNPFADGHPYRQELRLRQGEMEITAGDSTDRVKLLCWVDANEPFVRVSLTGRKTFHLSVRLENWRKEAQTISDQALGDSVGDSPDDPSRAYPAMQYPDTILEHQPDRISWFHHNTHSCWRNTLMVQGLETMTGRGTDPLMDRIFGGSIMGEGLIRQDDSTLVSSHPVHHLQVSIGLLTSRRTTTVKWLDSLNSLQDRAAKEDPLKAYRAHHAWWNDFWNRSWIRIQTKGDTGEILSRGYALQRWLAACGGRGGNWIKFNGSIFTLPWENADPDYRRWGGAQWFQNARLVYWPMIAAGDFDMLAPFYGAYLNALPLARERTRIYYHHGGAFFSETSYPWGTYRNIDYGVDRQGLEKGLTRNRYIRYYWTGGLELSVMMLDQYAITRSRRFLSDTLLPLAGAITEFYDKHWPAGPDGKIKFDPAQSLETWHEAVDPLPEIAGLKYVLKRLLQLPPDLIGEEKCMAWTGFLGRLPAIPMKTVHDSVYLLPAKRFGDKSNAENPELYAVFPYRLYGMGQPAIRTGINSYAVRENRENRCWWQDEIQAACLGLTREAAKGVAIRMSGGNPDFRFPAMWGPGNDELPDLDHGGVGQMALQYMLMQAVNDSIILFPAWPLSWDVDFRLHAPKGTVIEGELRDGRLRRLRGTPHERLRDIIFPLQMAGSLRSSSRK